MSVHEIVAAERGRFVRHRAAITVAAVVLLTCAALAIAAVALGQARWLVLPRAIPFGVLALILVSDAALVWLGVEWSRTQATTQRVAMEIERQHQLRSGALQGALEVDATGSLGKFAALGVVRTLNGGAALLPETRRGRRRSLGITGVGAVVALASLGASAPRYADGLGAVMHPALAWHGALLPPIRFDALPSAVLRGETVRLNIVAPGRRVITVERRNVGEGWTPVTIPVSADGRARADLGVMRADLHLVATDGRSSTDTVVVKSADRPYLGVSTLRATYPAYLGRPDEPLPVGEPIHVPLGTLIRIRGTSSTELRQVTLGADRDSALLDIAGRTFSGALRATRDGRAEWTALGAAGPIADLPLPIEIEVIPDSSPIVSIVSPATDTIVSPSDVIALSASATDDHGLATIALSSTKRVASGSDEPAHMQTLAPPRNVVWTGSLSLDLGPMQLGPGDELHVQLLATDNSPWHQTGASRELVLRVPTTGERRDLARALGDSAASAARSLAGAEKAMEQRTGDMSRDRAMRASAESSTVAHTTSVAGGGRSTTSGDMSYESADRARALASDQRALTDQVNKLRETARNLESQLRDANALDTALASQLRQAQALLAEALTPDLLAQMQKLESSAQDLSRGEAQTSLRDLQAMQQKLRDQLERSAALLQRAALEGAMQTLADDAKELAQHDQAAATAAGKAKAPSTTQALEQRTAHVDSAIKSLLTRLDQAQAQSGETHAADAEQQAARSDSSIRAATHDSAASRLGSASSQMTAASQALKEARDAQVAEWKHELTDVLDQSIQEMLELSRDESDMAKRVRAGGQATSERSAESAIKQGADAAAKKLAAEATKSSLLSSRSTTAVAAAEDKLQRAVQTTGGDGRGGDAATAMSDASQALASAAASLARDRERVNGASSATGLAEMLREMQQMANKQGAINSQAQGLLSLPGGANSPGAQGAARELARQQHQVAQQLDELGNGPGGDRAAQMADQAKQIAASLDDGKLTPETLARQQQLFHKMLDAGRSLEQDERDDSGRREATSASSGPTFTPGVAAQPSRGATKFVEPTWDELRSLPADERRAILEYFQRINGRGGH